MKRVFAFVLGVTLSLAIGLQPTIEEEAPDWCYVGTYDSIEDYPFIDNAQIIPKGNSIKGKVDVFEKCNI